MSSFKTIYQTRPGGLWTQNVGHCCRPQKTLDVWGIPPPQPRSSVWLLCEGSSPRPKHAYCAGLKGDYNPSPYAPTPPSNLYSSLPVFASLQSAFNAMQCHAASHKLKCDGELSLFSSVVTTCASQHAASLSHPERTDYSISVTFCQYGGCCFFIISHVRRLQK